MVADGLDPVTYDQTGHIQATLENAEVIAPFYPVVTDRQVRKALDSMVFYHHLLMARTRGSGACSPPPCGQPGLGRDWRTW